MTTTNEYETREMLSAAKREQEINRAPLADRKEAAFHFADVMATAPSIVAERAEWLLGGNFGFGEMMLSRRAMASKRSNRVAMLCQLIAVYEWQCPREAARKAWKGLTEAQQRAVDAALAGVVAAYDAESGA